MAARRTELIESRAENANMQASHTLMLARPPSRVRHEEAWDFATQTLGP